MILSHQYKCIFVGIPKCASTSIKDVFLKNKKDDTLFLGNNHAPYGHHTANGLKRLLDKEYWDNYFKFAITRDPYEWFISQYTDLVRYHYGDYRSTHFVLNEKHKLPDIVDNTITLPMALCLQSFLQFWSFCEATSMYERSLSQSIFINKDIDFIGDTNNLEEDWKYICEKCGIKDDLNKLNSSKRDGVKLSEEAKEFVKLMYKPDFDLRNKIFGGSGGNRTRVFKTVRSNILQA